MFYSFHLVGGRADVGLEQWDISMEMERINHFELQKRENEILYISLR